MGETVAGKTIEIGEKSNHGVKEQHSRNEDRAEELQQSRPGRAHDDRLLGTL